MIGQNNSVIVATVNSPDAAKGHLSIPVETLPAVIKALEAIRDSAAD